jgi:hypothetical protein
VRISVKEKSDNMWNMCNFVIKLNKHINMSLDIIDDKLIIQQWSVMMIS